MMRNLNELLEPLANQFRSLGIPEPIVRWGHPLMMVIVVFVIGNKAALRTVHAYMGSTALCILFLHAVVGLKLGLSI